MLNRLLCNACDKVLTEDALQHVDQQREAQKQQHLDVLREQLNRWRMLQEAKEPQQPQAQQQQQQAAPSESSVQSVGTVAAENDVEETVAAAAAAAPEK